MALSHEHITQALLSSDDDGETINLANWSFTEVSEAAGEELAAVGRPSPGEAGVVTRIALNSNLLNALPRSFEQIGKLRYLNLRANSFTTFPLVLTSLPKLEILDMSRNAITDLPPQPGTLTNLHVFSLARNLITRLPVYFTDFDQLRVLKLEGNPITWPPPDVWNRDKLDNEPHAKAWLNELKAWLLVNADDQMIGKQSSSDDEVLVARTHLARPFSSASNYAFQHERNFSTDSEISLTFDTRSSKALQPAFVPVPVVGGVPSDGSLPLAPQPRPTPPPQSDSAPSPADSSTFASHARGVSYSVETPTKASRRRTPMPGKKSMPNLRASSRSAFSTDHLSSERLPPPSTTSSSTELAPIPSPIIPQPQSKSTPPQPALPDSSDGAGPSKPRAPPPKKSRPPPRVGDNVAIDQERNTYFRRRSALPKPRAEAPQKMPPALSQTVDAIRGILFSLSQIYSAVRDYTASTIDERTSSVLVKVLDPASSYLSGLISALEKFDTASERGELPSPEICRTLIASCKDNVAVFGKVVGVLQLQLKVLASSHDPRYTRTLLLMLYGSMAEISFSWQAMLPHLAALIPLLKTRGSAGPMSVPQTVQTPGQRRGRHEPSLSNSSLDVPRPLRLDGTSPVRYAQSSVEKTPSPPGQSTANQSDSSIAPSRRALMARSRRQAGSFSSNDVEAGRMLPSRSPSEANYSATNGGASSPALPSPVLSQRPAVSRAASHQPPSVAAGPTSASSTSMSRQLSPLQPPSAPFAATSRSHSRGQSNSSSGSLPSPSLSNSSLAPPSSLAPLPSSSPLGTNAGSGMTASPSSSSSLARAPSPSRPRHADGSRSRSRVGGEYTPQAHLHRGGLSTEGLSGGGSVTTSRLVDADLLDAVELAASSAQRVWTMLESILRATTNVDETERKTHDALWDALDKVQGVTATMMGYFSDARDGDSEAGKKALGEDAQTFVKSTVQTLMLLRSFSSSHQLSQQMRGNITKLTAAMQEVTVFLHVSSYAPTPTPGPGASSFAGVPLTATTQQFATSGTMTPTPNTHHNPNTSAFSSRPYSPATFTNGGGLTPNLIPMTPASSVPHSAFVNGSFSSHPYDERNTPTNGGPMGGLGRSKSATAGPTPLKLPLGSNQNQGLSPMMAMTGAGDRDVPLTALPQNQAFRFGH